MAHLDVVDTANAICMRARQERAKQLRVATCSCGKAAVINGLCRGCSEDRFYGRDIQGAKIEGME